MPKKHFRKAHKHGWSKRSGVLFCKQARLKTKQMFVCFLWCQFLRPIVLHFRVAKISCKSQTLKGELGVSQTKPWNNMVASKGFQYHFFSNSLHGLKNMDWQGSIKPMKEVLITSLKYLKWKWYSYPQVRQRNIYHGASNLSMKSKATSPTCSKESPSFPYIMHQA